MKTQKYILKVKKPLGEMQTLRDGCSKADPQTNQHTDTDDYNYTLRRNFASAQSKSAGGSAETVLSRCKWTCTETAC